MAVPAETQLCYLIKWYRPGLDKQQLDSIATDVDRSSGVLARLKSLALTCGAFLTVAVPTDDVVFGVFAAGSADIVALACQRAGMPRFTAYRRARRSQSRGASIGETPDSASGSRLLASTSTERSAGTAPARAGQDQKGPQ